ncbi:MAG: HAMP domain-containing histidine kinase [Clostridia bacterium]|nr:HAMP domain-containing histidine kinase [Clostridia bacterium]
MSKEKNVNIDFNEQKQRFSLTLLFACIVFLILLTAIVLSVIAMFWLAWLGIIGSESGEIRFGSILLFMSGISLIIGSMIALLLGKIPLNPINKLVNGMNSLAAGNFKTRIEYEGLIERHPTFNEITKSFNTLAEELENTEVLRGDFINNFSHEFKTPIVSIAGFAKLLKKGNLSDEQRAEYLDAIEEESMRLSYMATNVLNMTKVENQTILSDVTRFNLSEQVRDVLLLLENAWTKKNIELQLDFDEYEIEANEELLKQVWINLIDNAVKFAPRCGTVAVDIKESEACVAVTVSNTGKEIDPEKLPKIFNKFYQADESHAGEGNGIGLAIVKRIVDLHGGIVTVISRNEMTSFKVELPRRQKRK